MDKLRKKGFDILLFGVFKADINVCPTFMIHCTNIIRKTVFFRHAGFDIPDHLDPAKRPRGRDVIEDGPITCLTTEQLEETQRQLIGGKIVQVDYFNDF